MLCYVVIQEPFPTCFGHVLRGTSCSVRGLHERPSEVKIREFQMQRQYQSEGIRIMQCMHFLTCLVLFPIF
jgi:hypothetical protein